MKLKFKNQDFQTKAVNAVADLFIGQYMIAVKIEGKDDTLFFNKHKRGKHPFFIRTSETPKFIIEKMQNLITRMMLIQQKHFMEQKK